MFETFSLRTISHRPFLPSQCQNNLQVTVEKSIALAVGVRESWEQQFGHIIAVSEIIKQIEGFFT